MGRAGRPPILSAHILEALRHELMVSPVAFGYGVGSWSGRILSLHLRRRYGTAISPRHCRRILAKLGVGYRKPACASQHSQGRPTFTQKVNFTPALRRMFVSDLEQKRRALRNLRRLCNSGLPLTPLISGIFDVVQQAVPNCDNKVFLVGSGASPSRYLMNNPELARWTPVHKHYYIEAPSSVSGLRIRFVEPDLSSLFYHVAGTSEDLALPHFRRSEGYNEFLRPLGFDHMLWVTFADDAERLGLYPIWRSAQMRSFSRDDLKFVRLAAPHIAQALKVASLIEDGKPATLDQFLGNPKPGLGTVVLDERRRVVGVDKQAEAMFAEMAIAEGLRPELAAPDRAHELFSYIAQALESIFQDPTDNSVLDVPVIRLYCHRTGALFKMRGVSTRSVEGKPYFIVLLERGELRAHRRTRLAATLGLSATDIALLDGLRNGLSGAQLALNMGITIDTLRVYLRRLSAKLDP